jgi:serine/threonine protein kinase
MKSFFGDLFRRRAKGNDESAIPGGTGPGESGPGPRASYRKGDLIGGRHEVLAKLGQGGFGIVYLVKSETGEICALKTFRDELLAAPAARAAFKKEAMLWVTLGSHPFILSAWWVSEVSGRLFVAMEYIKPDAQGRVSLANFLAGSPLDGKQILTWAIQFCSGMEHANSHGVECHRDVKPANILIQRDGTLKISDFGLAGATEAAWWRCNGSGDALVKSGENPCFSLSVAKAHGRKICGTPGYMPPEMMEGEASDKRSDVYSFGLILWQMATGSQTPPFLVRWGGNVEDFIFGIYERQRRAQLPRVGGALQDVITRCLRPERSQRYQTFSELRGALEHIWERETGMGFAVPEAGQTTATSLNNKAASLTSLGRSQEAVECCNQAIAIVPDDPCPWINKGNALHALRRHREAVECYDRALALDLKNSKAWLGKGTALWALDREREALACYDQALALDPRDARIWFSKAFLLDRDGCREEGLRCCDKALEIDANFSAAWNNKGRLLGKLGRYAEALECFQRALEMNPADPTPWRNKALFEDALGHGSEALKCYRRFVDLASPQEAGEVGEAQARIATLEHRFPV